MQDVLILGGGVIGLSLAYELAGRGLRVQVLDKATPGTEASWAGAGILPPANLETATDPYDQLAGLSLALHPVWAQRLREETGIDTGYRRCGGIYLDEPGNQGVVATTMRKLQQRGISAEALSVQALAAIEPMLARPAVSDGPAAWLLSDECQLRNPWHLRALVAACGRRGVTIEANAEVEEFSVQQGRIESVRAAGNTCAAGQYVLTSGAWTDKLARRLGVQLPIKPIRGQIALLRSSAPLARIVNVGPRYLVPRGDGRILVGSTEEDVGFEKRTTEDAIAELLRLASELVPALATAPLEQSWAGLRPATTQGIPYLGPLGGLQNAYVAAGHFRSGLTLSTGTAVVLAELLTGQQTQIDLRPFHPPLLPA